MNETNTATGITLPCLYCAEPAESISIGLHLDNRLFHCSSCLAEWTGEEAKERVALLAKWAKVIAWVESMPTD